MAVRSFTEVPKRARGSRGTEKDDKDTKDNKDGKDKQEKDYPDKAQKDGKDQKEDKDGKDKTEKDKDINPDIGYYGSSLAATSHGGGIGERVAALEATVSRLLHFIPTSLRPDLTAGALAREADVKRSISPKAGRSKSRAGRKGKRAKK